MNTEAIEMTPNLLRLFWGLIVIIELFIFHHFQQIKKLDGQNSPNRKDGLESCVLLFLWILISFELFSGHAALTALIPAAILLLSAYCAFWQDWITYWFSPWWLLDGVICLGAGMNFSAVSLIQRILGLLPAAIMCFFALRRLCGWADPLFLAVMGFVLGLERILACVLISTILALVYGLMMKKRVLPFVSFLTIGFMCALLWGYRLYFLIIHLW